MVANAPKPKIANTDVMTVREMSSILPRRVRKPLTNMRQRRTAIAVSCARTLVTEVMRDFILAHVRGFLPTCNVLKQRNLTLAT